MQLADASTAATASPARPPRVCFVNLGAVAALDSGHDDHPVGGEEVQHALLASAFAAKGWDVSLVTHDLGQADGARIDGVRVHGCYAPHAGWPGLRFITPRWTGLHAALRRADADVYYTSCAGSLIGQVALFAQLHQRRTVFRIASDTDCVPARVLVGTARERALYHWGLRRCDVVLAQTPLQVDLMQQHHRIAAALAPMLIDLPEDTAAIQHAPRDIDVLWVANLRALKRPEMLVEAARQLPHLKFHLVGGATEAEPEVAERVTQAARDVPNLTLHGRRGYRDTLTLFARARVFVSTSHTEGFPNTFLQAWAHEVPSVSFFDPDGLVARHGLGARIDAFEALVQAIDRLSSDPTHHAHAAQACRTFMRTRYRRDALLAPYEQAFMTLHSGPTDDRTGARPCLA
jgi:glycosyltransferase involved in cell wall biosynthesis